LLKPFASVAGANGGRPAFAVETMLLVHFLQQWFGLSDPVMKKALHDASL
jgi:IS5 family transposase